MKHFDLHTIYTLTTEKGAITPQGRTLIKAFIASTNINSDEWNDLNPNRSMHYLPQLPDVDVWAWHWIAYQDDFRGTFPKRVSKWYKLAYSLNCPKSFIEKIGNLARQHSLEAYTYRFDFTDRFDWDDGDFGDSGSCYWGSNYEARELLEDNGCLAIRFYDENKEGIGRAWLFPTEDFYIVFNGYGFTTLEIAKIFATWAGLNYKKINLYNNDESTGLIYINGSGSGYAVGEYVEDVKRYDFEIYTPNGCYACGRDMGENSYTGADDEEYCMDCFYDRFDYCRVCDDTYRQHDLYYVESEEIDVCDYCLSTHFTRCDYCTEYWRDNRVTEDKQGRAKCEGCRDKD
jgi:hypothetical protein